MTARALNISKNIALLLLILSLTACDHMSRTQQRVLLGGVVGAGLGAATTALSGGCVACGAAIGGAAGAGASYLLDQWGRK